MKVTAVIPSAGAGRRMKGLVEKPYLMLGEKPLLIHTLLNLSRVGMIDAIIPVVDSARLDNVRDLIDRFEVPRVKNLVAGDSTRTGSVYSGLKVVDEDTDIVLIHDGVRPFVSREIIKESINTAAETGAAVTGVPVTSTIKRVVLPAGTVESTVDRSGLWIIQTPQTFRREIILAAYQKAVKNNEASSDDAGLVEKMGVRVKVIMGSYLNIKITTPEDLFLARMLLAIEEHRENKD